MVFLSTDYSSGVQSVLAVDGDGVVAMPLANGRIVQAGVDAIGGRSGRDLFPGALSPEGALSGLHLYFCDYDRAHAISQELSTPEGSFWHGILHRQEPDPGNAAYWFRRVGLHPIFPALRDAAAGVHFPVKKSWDPFAFIDYCEEARRKPGSKDEETAMAVQLAEWQLLFDYCARPRR